MGTTPELLQKIDVTLFKGVESVMEFRLSTGKRIYKQVGAVTLGAPVSITVSGHGMPDGWDFWLTDLVGPTVLNRDEPGARYVADVVDAGTVEINDVNGVGMTAYESGGWIKYLEPENLAGATATMEWRKSFDTSAIVTLTEADDIEIDNTDKTVATTLSEANIVLLAAEGTVGVWNLKVTLGDGRTVTAGYGPYTILETG